MRVRRLAPVLPLALVLAVPACSASEDTGTETQPSFDAQAPAYEVVSDDESDDGEDITVSVGTTPQSLAVEAIVGELQEDRTGDGVYDLTVVCSDGGAELATATWAQGGSALEESGLSEGDIDTDVVDGTTCGS